MNPAARRNHLILGIALAWAIFNVLAYTGMAASGFVVDGFQLGADLDVYLTGAMDLIGGRAVYDLTPGRMDTVLTYRYHPAFLLPMSLLAALPEALRYPLWFGFTAVAYLGGLYIWYRVLKHLGVAVWLPAFAFAIVAYDWFGNLSFGNIGPAMVGLSALLMLAVVRRQMVSVAILAGIIAVMKPQWCFPLLYPLLVREYRVFIRLVLSATLGFAVVNGAFLLIVGVERGLSLISDYVQFVRSLYERYPFVGSEGMFSTLQNSLYQTFLRYSDNVMLSAWGAALTQVGLIGSWLVMLWRVNQTRSQVNGVRVTLAAYIVAMCMLPQLEEALLAGVIVAAVAQHVRAVGWLFGAYALLQIPAWLSILLDLEALFIPQLMPTNLIMLLVAFGATLMVILPRPISKRETGEYPLPSLTLGGSRPQS